MNQDQKRDKLWEIELCDLTRVDERDRDELKSYLATKVGFRPTYDRNDQERDS